MLYNYNEEELEVIRSHDSPKKVQAFLDGLIRNHGEHLSFRGVVKTGSANCLDAAIAGAVILENHGYEPLIMEFNRDIFDFWNHTLFFFEKDGIYGTVGTSSNERLWGNPEGFSSLRELMRSYEPTVRLISYQVTNMNRVTGCDWRLSDRPILEIEECFAEYAARETSKIVFPDIVEKKSPLSGLF